MAWSTREVADLAGTTVKAVRHYHEVGLLEEPERTTNGYKQYGVRHLVRLLRIRRLVDLGVTLPQIAALADDEHPGDLLRSLDQELETTIAHLQRIRAELGRMLKDGVPTDLPAELAAAAGELGEADRTMATVYARVLPPDGVEPFQRMLADFKDHPTAVEFAGLPADADDDRRADVARRMVPMTIEMVRRHPDVIPALAQGPGGPAHVDQTLRQAIGEVYNPAQLDVLDRVGRMVRFP